MSKLLDIDVNEFLVALLESYDIKLEEIEDFYFANGFFPGIAAHAFEMENFGDSVVVQLDITLIFQNERFVESFVAQATTVEDAIANTFEQFETNVLHALIMAFWEQGKKVENGVGRDVWEINGHRWEVVVSNYGYRGSEELDDILPDLDMMFDAIKSSIEAYPLTKEVYAVRTVYNNTTNNEPVIEALINNEEFPELQQAIAKLEWKPSDDFYSIRNLVLLMRLRDEEQEEA
jgi:hypothetical protein